MATHSSILTWRIPQTEETGRLQSIGSQRVRHSWSNLACMHVSTRQDQLSGPAARTVTQRRPGAQKSTQLEVSWSHGTILKFLTFSLNMCLVSAVRWDTGACLAAEEWSTVHGQRKASFVHWFLRMGSAFACQHNILICNRISKLWREAVPPSCL